VRPRRCAFVCASVRVVYIYIILLYCIPFIYGSGLGRRTKECYLQLSFIRRRVVEFPFWWSYNNNNNNNKETIYFFPLLFFLLQPVVCRWGRGCNPEPDVLTRVLIYRFPFTVYAHCLPGPKKPTDKYLQFCQPNKYYAFVLTLKYSIRRNSKDIVVTLLIFQEIISTALRRLNISIYA